MRSILTTIPIPFTRPVRPTPAEPAAANVRESFYRRHKPVVLFVLGLVAFDLFLGQFHTLWQRHSPDDYASRVRGCGEQARDFVLVGGSPVAEGLNPAAVAGFPWHSTSLTNGYTLGMPGGTTSDFYHAVLHGCPTPPRLLVYGITASDLNDSREEPHGPHSLLTIANLAEWTRVRPEASEWAVRHFVRGRFEQASSLFRYRHAIRMWAALAADSLWPGCSPETVSEAREQRDYAAGIVAGNGYSPMKGFEHAHFSEFKKIGMKGTRFDHLHYLNKYRTGSHLKYLGKLIDWCKARQVELVLLDMPVSADLERLYPREFAEFRERLSEVERTHGLKVLRPTRDQLGLTDDQFADLIHMNRDGAARLSGWLRVQLSEAHASR